jgi:chemotaxis protein CheD
MYDHRLSSFEQPVTLIHPGEYLVSGDDMIISTVLGSCVAVALKDRESDVGGLNHFMLPSPFKRFVTPDFPAEFISDDGRYGSYAMELLINEMMKRGAKKSRIQAKVFGGASLLHLGPSPALSIASGNIDFAFEFLKTEGIPVISSDVGGDRARKILFFVRSGKVLLKRIQGTFNALVGEEDRTYLNRITSKMIEGSVVWFKEPR